MAMRTYRELDVWHKAKEFAAEVYRVSALFPPEEKFGLTHQVRRAAISIPSNIAEGYGRSHRKEYLNFLSMTKGSLNESETQFLIAVDLKFVTQGQIERAWELAQETGRPLNGLIRSLREQPRPLTPDP